MDDAIKETVELLRLRAELRALLRRPGADREIMRRLLLHRTTVTATDHGPAGPCPDTI